jgi:MarR family transcriptional regulator for hemolysin
MRAELMSLLHDVARLHRVAADKRARRHGMTRAQWIMLVKLERQPGLSQRELAEILEVEPITVARLVDRLEQLGMVERRPDPKDRRIWRLHLCPPAEPVLQEIEEERNDLAGLTTAALDDATVDDLVTAMADMRSRLCAEVRAKGRTDAAIPSEPEALKVA